METIKTYQTLNNNGEYSCGDLGITEEEWYRLLQSAKSQRYISTLVAFLREPENTGSCYDVSIKYGNTPQHYNSKIINFSKQIKNDLNRFQIIGVDGNETYWCIAMQKGWKEKDLFKWRLRDELVEALRRYLINDLIEQFRKREYSLHVSDELYKWQLLDKTNGKEPIEIVQSLLGNNIIDNARTDHVLKYLLNNNSESLTSCCQTLFDETHVLSDRIAVFKTTMKSMCPTDWRVYANDERTASALLSCRYPELYTFYKDEVYQLICQYLGYDSKKAGLKFQHFTEIINKLTALHGDDVQSIISKEIASVNTKPKNLAIQTLFWCMRDYMKEQINKNMSNSNSADRTYWLAGYNFGRNDTQLDRFLQESIWEGGFDLNKTNDKKQYELALEIKPGDIILLKSTSTKGPKHDKPFIRISGIGIVEKHIDTRENGSEVSCMCSVNYINTEIIDFDGQQYGAYRNTLHKADSKVLELIEYVNSIIDLDENMPNKYQMYIDLLQETHNLVLTGAPGTGKTYMAQAIAQEMGCTNDEMCFVQFHPSYDYSDFVEGLRPVEFGDGQMGFERKDGVFKEFCKNAAKNIADSQKSVEILGKELSWEEKVSQFVEDAIASGNKFKLTNGNEFSIEGISSHSIVVTSENIKKPHVSVSIDDIIELLTNEVKLVQVQDIRKFFNRKYGTQPDSYAFILVNSIREMNNNIVVSPVSKIDRKPYVFIIDEINRGEVSKIFGELFYAIDPGYRGKTDIRVKTQYQNLIPESDIFAKGFYVPENVYILATMNDIDRSVESMDFAMRRRFTWEEITPEDTEDMLNTLPCAEDAKKTMARLNNVIAETDGLGSAYMIGPSYFLKLKDNGGDFEKLWKMNIAPLLKEYLRGFRKMNEQMDEFHKAFFGTEPNTTTKEQPEESAL